MHLCRSKYQKMALADQMLKMWREQGEPEVVACWERYTMKPRRYTSVGAPACATTAPNNNPQELYHRD